MFFQVSMADAQRNRNPLGVIGDDRGTQIFVVGLRCVGGLLASVK